MLRKQTKKRTSRLNFSKNFYPRMCLLIFREKGRGWGETHGWERETSIGYLPYAP